MDRLINSNELIQIIEGNENLISLQKEELIECVNACDTAYDVETVEEQLDEYITKIVGRKSALYQTVMQIVKGGCVDAKTDS